MQYLLYKIKYPLGILMKQNKSKEIRHEKRQTNIVKYNSQEKPTRWGIINRAPAFIIKKVKIQITTVKTYRQNFREEKHLVFL